MIQTGKNNKWPARSFIKNLSTRFMLSYHKVRQTENSKATRPCLSLFRLLQKAVIFNFFGQIISRCEIHQSHVLSGVSFECDTTLPYFFQKGKKSHNRSLCTGSTNCHKARDYNCASRRFFRYLSKRWSTLAWSGAKISIRHITSYNMMSDLISQCHLAKCCCWGVVHSYGERDYGEVKNISVQVKVVILNKNVHQGWPNSNINIPLYNPFF